MAFAVASRRTPLAVAGLLKQLLLAAPSASRAGAAAAALRPASVVSVRHLFSRTTGATPFSRDEYSGDKEEVVYDRVRSTRGFTKKVADPAAGDEPIMCQCGRSLEEAAASRRGCLVLGAVWWSKEDVDAVKLKVAMPGLGKEHVKVWADPGQLRIDGEADKDPEYDDDEEPPAKHGHYIDFPTDTFKMDQVEAEMKHGVLKVTLPKIKPEDRNDDAFQVKAEEGKGWSVQVS